MVCWSCVVDSGGVQLSDWQLIIFQSLQSSSGWSGTPLYTLPVCIHPVVYPSCMYRIYPVVCPTCMSVPCFIHARCCSVLGAQRVGFTCLCPTILWNTCLTLWPVCCIRGLILQDLTFVHLGNPDSLMTSQGSRVNFSKQWQQFNILDTLRSYQQVSVPTVLQSHSTTVLQ